MNHNRVLTCHRRDLLRWSLVSPAFAAGASSVRSQGRWPQAGEPLMPVEAVQRLGLGINLDGYFESVSPGLWGHSYTPDDIVRARAAGFTSVRLPVRWDTHTSRDIESRIDPAFFELIDRYVDACERTQTYCILDVHHFRSLDGDPPDLEETWRPPADSAGPRLRNLWRQIAEHYRQRGNWLIFDIYNEPHGALTAGRWNALYRTIRDDIRRSQSDRLLMLAAPNYAAYWDLWSLERDLFDRYTLASVHWYEPHGFTHQGAYGARGPARQTFGLAAQHDEINTAFGKLARWTREHPQHPVVLGEFGVNHRRIDGSYVDRSSRVTYAQAIRSAALAHGITATTWWGYRGQWGMFDQPQHPGQWEPGFLGALGLKEPARPTSSPASAASVASRPTQR